MDFFSRYHYGVNSISITIFIPLGCIDLWIPLLIISMAFILSLTCNIVHCVIKHRKGEQMKYYNQCTVSYEQPYMEDNPIYGNLNHPILEHIDESCYEQMSNPSQRNREQIKVDSAITMCYATLNLSPKSRKKNAPPTNSQDVVRSHTDIRKILSRSSIYLNNDQLMSERQIEDNLIHDNPIRISNIIQKNKNNMGIQNES
ncbi:T-cell receptor-associated transmembrane adapter 1 [Pelodytes ibericus]